MFLAPYPAHLPALSTILDDLSAKPEKIARYLDVSPSTLARWRAAEGAPRAAHLALYWESKWGRSQIYCNQVNEIRLLYGQVQMLERQLERCARIVAGLRSMCKTDTANEPIFEDASAFAEFPRPPFVLNGGAGAFEPIAASA